LEFQAVTGKTANHLRNYFLPQLVGISSRNTSAEDILYILDYVHWANENTASALGSLQAPSPGGKLNLNLEQTILKRLNFVKISLDLISPVYYGQDSLRRKMPFVSYCS